MIKLPFYAILSPLNYIFYVYLYNKRTHMHVSLFCVILRALQIFLLFFTLFMPEVNYNPGKIGLYKYTLFFLLTLCEPSNLDFIYKTLFLLDLHKED